MLKHVEYTLITCFPKALPVFSPFSFNSHCLYSAYISLAVSLLPLSTLSCVPCFLPPSKYSFHVLITPFRHSRSLCCSTPSFSVSAVSPKISALLNTLSTFAIIFITC